MSELWNLKEVSDKIADEILSDNIIRKEHIVPRIEAILKAFMKNSIIPDFNKIPNPSEHAKRMLSLYKKKAENEYWKDVVKKLDGANMNIYFTHLENFLKARGFID